MALKWCSIRRAMPDDNGGRPFLIVGVEQGGTLATRLIAEAVADAATEHERSPAPVTPEREPASGVGRTVGWVSLGSGVALVVAGAALVRVGRTDVDFLESAEAGDGTAEGDGAQLRDAHGREAMGERGEHEPVIVDHQYLAAGCDCIVCHCHW